MTRRYELDMCRIFACLMVVMLHVASSGWYTDPMLYEWKVFNVYDMATRAGVALFFMISGILFLERDKLDIQSLVSKNVARLLLIFCVWSILYELYNQWIFHQYENVYSFLKGIIKGYYHLWFLPVMAFVYLFVPVVYHAIHRNGELNSVYIFALFLCIVVLKTNLLIFYGGSELVQEVCKKIDLSRLSYLGYMVTGYIISQLDIARKYSKKRLLISTSIIYLVVTALSAYGNLLHSLKEGVATDWLYGDFSLPVFIQACCIFIFFQCFRNKKIKNPRKLIYLSDCTLGVYILHPMFIEYFKRSGFSVYIFNPVVSVPCVFIIVVLVSFLVSSFFRTVPVVKKVV